MGTSAKKPPSEARKQHLQISRGEPRNATELMFLEKYGSITPVPQQTLSRKNTVVIACILYLHQGMKIDEICKMLSINLENTHIVKRQDGWDEFGQELVQLAKPSQLSMIKSHDIPLVQKEAARRAEDAAPLIKAETDLMKALEKADAGSANEARILGNIKKARELTDEVTGLARFNEEMSAARKSGLIGMSKSVAKDAVSPTKAKGKIIDLS